VLARSHLDDLVLPADRRRGQLRQPVDQDLLEMVLLQVDERRTTMPALRQQVEGIDLLVAEERPPDLPLDTLLHDPLAAAQPVKDLERALRVADRARSDAHGVVVVEHDHRHVVQREVDRCRETDRPGADDDYGVPSGRAVLIRRPLVGVDRVGVRLHHKKRWTRRRAAPAYVFYPSNASHIALSRCAVQIRGSLYSVASS
jgi:hypothetical protein